MHDDLDVYKKSIDLVVGIYKVTKSFPKDEKFGLVNQMRRAAVSIPSNISEGYGRKSLNELIRFLYISKGSLNELETQITVSERLCLINENDSKILKIKITEISKMLCSLINSIDKKRKKILGEKNILKEEMEIYG